MHWEREGGYQSYTEATQSLLGEEDGVIVPQQTLETTTKHGNRIKSNNSEVANDEKLMRIKEVPEGEKNEVEGTFVFLQEEWS